MGNELSVLYPSAAAPVEPGAANVVTGNATRATAPVIYSGSPMERPPDSVLGYAASMPYPPGSTPQNSELEIAKAAMLKLGVGITAARAFYLMALHEHQHGPYQVTDEEAIAELRTLWGDELDTKLDLVRGLAREVAKTWPGFASYLNRTRLGSYPPWIKLMAQHAEQRAAKR